MQIKMIEIDAFGALVLGVKSRADHSMAPSDHLNRAWGFRLGVRLLGELKCQRPFAALSNWF